jgi:choline-glycine betaine transporter
LTGGNLTYGYQVWNALNLGTNMTSLNNASWLKHDVNISRTTNLYQLGMTDILFEHLSCYGGYDFSIFMTLVTWVCVLLYFVTSSDSASFVVDMIAANGILEPPIVQKVFWCITERDAAGK